VLPVGSPVMVAGHLRHRAAMLRSMNRGACQRLPCTLVG
jgi:hypothetical protein